MKSTCCSLLGKNILYYVSDVDIDIILVQPLMFLWKRMFNQTFLIGCSNLPQFGVQLMQTVSSQTTNEGNDCKLEIICMLESVMPVLGFNPCDFESHTEINTSTTLSLVNRLIYIGNSLKSWGRFHKGT